MKKIKLVLLLSLILLSCTRGGGGTGGKGGDTIVGDTTPIKSPIVAINSTPSINIYIENSGSMDGYVQGNTEFKGAIRDLMVLLKHYYGNEEAIKVHFINSAIRESNTHRDLASFAQNINAYWRARGDDISSSNLNNVFKMILEKTDKNTISILFSDCIYSIKGKDAIGLLSDQKSLTKDAFLSRWKVDSLKLATTIVKLTSKFTGIYYDKDNVRTTLTGKERPYYICVLGNNDAMNNFKDKIPLEKDKIEGFENKYVISSGSKEEIYYTILLSTYNAGRFRPDRKLSTNTYVHGIKDVNLRNMSRGGASNFTFAVAVDLNDVKAEEDYYMTSENYTLSDDNFKIKEIKKVNRNEINASDWVMISASNPTHILVFEATGTAISTFNVSLKKQMPKWIDETNTEDDSNILSNLDKTFGVKYLIEGIAESYQVIYPEDKYFFDFEINIKK